MNIFINGTGIISTQQTFDKAVLENGFQVQDGNRWVAKEPDYSQFIDGKQIRRMSRIIRMGIVSAMLTSRESGIDKPEAIIVGTAFGCLEDTYSFLSKLVQHKEEMLSPTAFIHSTHNTIAAQIALLFQSHGYNSTYVHRALSFESAVTDAMMLLEEGSANNILVGGIDEITETSFTIMDRMGFFKKEENVSGENIYDNPGKGSIAGEGSAFFSLSGVQTSTTYAKLCGVEQFSFTGTNDVVARAKEMLLSHQISKPDLLITGHNGDAVNDEAHDRFANELDCNDRMLKYKHWSGEFATASAFAMWLGAEILKAKQIPGSFDTTAPAVSSVKNILIYNQQEGNHHSIILLSSC